MPYTRAYSFILEMYPFFILVNSFLPLARLFFTGTTFFTGATFLCWGEFFLLARLFLLARIFFAGVTFFAGALFFAGATCFRWRNFFSGSTFWYLLWIVLISLCDTRTWLNTAKIAWFWTMRDYKVCVIIVLCFFVVLIVLGLRFPTFDSSWIVCFPLFDSSWIVCF